MESISSNANQGTPSVVRAPETTVPREVEKLKIKETNTTKLMDFNGLAERVDSSGSIIRPEVVERGKALVSDPNWPNDALIEGLANTLFEEENFDA
jgi:hypothetical protein